MAEARAHTNIAIVKYWGKHPKWEDHHIPTKSSLSFTVKDLYTETSVTATPGSGRVLRFVLNEKELSPHEKEFSRVQKYVEKLGRYVSKDVLAYDYIIFSRNNFPTAAGLASSASGFAALAKALMAELAKEHSWAEEALKDGRKLSALARLGSGSASRSVAKGIVLWRRGWDEENFDPLWGSYAETVASPPPDIVLIYVFVEKKKKKVSSSEGMKISRDTSPFYWYWVENEEKEIMEDAKHARKGDEAFFRRIMVHSNSLHAICRSSFPPIEYLNDESREVMERIHSFINEYGPVAAYTFDAGPNPVIFVKEDALEELKREVLQGFEFFVTKPL